MQTKLHVEIEINNDKVYRQFYNLELALLENVLIVNYSCDIDYEKKVFNFKIYEDMNFHYNNFKRYYENDYFTIYLKYENDELKFVKTEKGYLQNSK